LIKTLQTHFINVSKSYLCCGTQRQSSRGAFMHKTMFSRKMCLHFILQKRREYFIETVAPRWSVFTRMLSSIPEKVSFCWIGFCARDCFKHSEAKWRQLPRLFSEALETGTAPCLHEGGTLVPESSLRAFFCQSPVASA